MTPTCRWRTSPAARPGSRFTSTGSRSRPSTAARRGCSSPTSTSGRAPSGCAAWSSARRTGPASGSATATTTAGIRGLSSATGATDFQRAPMPGAWREAELAAKRVETPTAATLELRTDAWSGHRAGQHVDVRLTAEDGYRAQRSYSIASPPEDGRLALTVERLDDGEVSPYLVDEMQPGDALELRGPIGGWFVWDTDDGGPLLLVAGGSGLVPLMAMARHRSLAGSDVPARLLLSVTRPEAVLYEDELESLAAAGDGLTITTTFTREAPPD